MTRNTVTVPPIVSVVVMLGALLGGFELLGMANVRTVAFLEIWGALILIRMAVFFFFQLFQRR